MGNRNKKSNLRKITVDEQIYYWNVSSPNCDGDGNCRFDIWKNGIKIYDGLAYKNTITPKDVREQISTLNE